MTTPAPLLLGIASMLSLILPSIAVVAPAVGQSQSPISAHDGQFSNVSPSQDRGIQNAANPVYRLGPGDQLAIDVFGFPEFTGVKVVLPDGTIGMPLIGSLVASGKTTDELAQELTARLSALLVDPVVTVSLTVLRPVLVTVAGEVERPGPLQLRSLTTVNLTVGGNNIQGTPTVSAALIEAGGVTSEADIRKIILRRYNSSGNSEPIEINLWSAIASDDPPPDYILQDGDAIYVPRLDPEDTLDRRLVVRSSFAPATVRVRVVGQVNNPGEVEVPPNSTLSSAVAIAGGPNGDANLDRVALVRMNEAGRVERQIVNLNNFSDNNQVQNGDVIIVPRSTGAAILDTITPFFSPINFFIDLFQ